MEPLRMSSHTHTANKTKDYSWHGKKLVPDCQVKEEKFCFRHDKICLTSGVLFRRGLPTFRCTGDAFCYINLEIQTVQKSSNLFFAFKNLPIAIIGKYVMRPCATKCWQSYIEDARSQ